METESENTPDRDQTPPRFSLAAVRRLFALARPFRLLLSVAAVLMVISTGVSLSVPLVARQTLNSVVQTRQATALDRLALALIGLLLLGGVIGYLQFLLMAYAGNRIVMGMRARLFAHLQRLPVAFFDHARSGDLASRLSNDVSLLQQTLTDDLIRLIGNVLTLAGGVPLVIFIDWRLTGVILTLLALLIGTFLLLGQRLRRMTREALDALSDAMGTMTEALANVRLVKAFAREAYEDERAAGKLDRVFRLNMISSAWEGAMGTTGFAGFVLLLLGVGWYGGRSVLDGSLSPGSLLAFLMTILIISGPLGTLAPQFGRLQRAIGAADRLFAILDDAPEAPDPPDAASFPDGPGHVVFEEVDFSYTPENPVLRRLSLDVPAGSVTALVGASGAGKTTLAMLLYRFYEPQSGRILLDGAPLEVIRRQALREHIGLVPQEPILFNGTIRENIRYGRLDATDAEVAAAARAANVEEFVAPLRKGFETILGERGITLSGGQRQRVAIARAVLKDPRILILDEATSALDTRSETLVREALERLMRGRTTLVIAHRLTTIQNADQIAVLDGGRVVESGRHDDLMRRGGRYAALHGHIEREEAPADLVPQQ
jgi:subfamily B ATP-binding cassette protein MsbA